MPNFFASTKFFSCLDLKESQELFEQTQMVGPRLPCLMCMRCKSLSMWHIEALVYWMHSLLHLTLTCTLVSKLLPSVRAKY